MTGEEINLRALASATLNPTLRDLCEKSANRIKALEEALRFYARGGNAAASIEDAARGDIDLALASEVLTEDCGEIARAALKSTT